MNKLFWKITSAVGVIIIEEILDALATWVVTQLTLVQSTSLVHSEQLFLDESDGLGVYLAAFSKSGDAGTGDLGPSFLAMSLTKGVGNRLTRPGGLRIGGVMEAASEGNVLTTEYLAALNGIGAEFEAPKQFIDSGGGMLEFTAVVVGRTPEGALDLARVNTVTNFSSPRLTSQVSRRAI
jgi:hypothetical protein